MNLLNRILIMILALTIMAGSILLLLPFLNLIPLETIGLPLWLTEQLRPFIESDWQTHLIFGGIVFGAFLVGVGLLYIGLRLLFSPEKRLLILQDELGKVEIAQSCIGKYISYEARLFSQISKVKSQISKKKDGLLIKSTIFVKPDAKINEISQTLQDKLKNNLEKTFGLVISRIIIVAKINSDGSSPKRTLK